MTNKEQHTCTQVDNISLIREDTKEIKEDITEIKVDLREHMTRTKYNEQRIELMEDFAKASLKTQQDNFNAMLKSNKDNQAALNKQLKIALGIFAALAALVSALVPLINH
jgi:3-isopropylmalate dehydratase small subunit